MEIFTFTLTTSIKHESSSVDAPAPYPRYASTPRESNASRTSPTIISRSRTITLIRPSRPPWRCDMVERSHPAFSPPHNGELTIHFGDNLSILRELPSASFDLIYIDPPFNTG